MLRQNLTLGSCQTPDIFEWNVAAHPQSANVHDSLGEAYLGAGRRDDARRSYQNALRMDPSSTSAKAALAGL